MQLVLMCFLFIISAPLLAFDINVNVGGYPGRYTINSGVHNFGNKVFSLTEGTHTFSLVDGGLFTFSVSSGGVVNSNNTSIATGSGDTLLLNTITVAFDPGDYELVYNIGRSPSLLGQQNIAIPSNIQFALRLPEGIAADLYVNSNGIVSRMDSKNNMQFEPFLVKFKTRAVTVDAKKYSLIYTLMGGVAYYGKHTYHLVPEADYKITYRGITGSDLLTTISIDENNLINFSGEYYLGKENSIEFFSTPIEFTPPGSFSGTWYIYGGVHIIGMKTVKLFHGKNYKLGIVGDAEYTFNAGDCSSTGSVLTSVGTFTFECVSDPSYEFDLDDENFNFIGDDFNVEIDGSNYLNDIGDFDLEINGVSTSLIDATINPNTLTLYNLLVEGRNSIEISGKDYLGNSILINDVFWAGSAEVTVETDVDSTVELEIEYFDGVNTYDFSVSQDTVDNIAVFKNVPQLEGTITVTSTAREVKKRIKVLPETKIKIENR